MQEIEGKGQQMRELGSEETALVGGAGFLEWLTEVLSGGRETSIPANNADLGIRG